MFATKDEGTINILWIKSNWVPFFGLLLCGVSPRFTIDIHCLSVYHGNIPPK